MINLSVNVNKVATLRNARGGDEPSVVQAARICINAGCQGITVHPRADQRHIRPSDVRDLAAMLATISDGLAARVRGVVEFNIEGNPRPDLLDLVCEVRPTQCTLVPVTPGEVTSDHGWNVAREETMLRQTIARLRGKGIRVSLFMDANPFEMEKAAAVGAHRVELYTAPYAWAKSEVDIQREFAKLRDAHDAAVAAGLEVNAGHDLNTRNLPRLQQLDGLKEVSIGHALISDALYVGLERAVKDYRRACGQFVD